MPDADNVTLAEYSALRAEILTHTSVQQTLLGAAITLSGVLAGFALQGNDELVLLLPIATLLLGAAYADESRKIYVIARYIVEVLACRDGAEGLKGWEESRQRHRLTSVGSAVLQVTAFGLFPLMAQAYVLWWVGASEKGYWLLGTGAALGLCLYEAARAGQEKP